MDAHPPPALLLRLEVLEWKWIGAEEVDSQLGLEFSVFPRGNWLNLTYAVRNRK